MIQEKALIRVKGAEIAETLINEESLYDLKKLISDVYHFDGLIVESEHIVSL